MTAWVRAVPLRRRRSRVPWIYSVYHARRGKRRGARGANSQLPTPNSQIKLENWELGVEEAWDLGVEDLGVNPYPSV